tara:strand:- start:10781 stop:11167 length:387 start_codon:yes stop_codon:yes gene_type:complete
MDIRVYLGRDWQRLGFNCWALVREIYAAERGQDLPLVPVDPDQYRDLLHAFAKHPAHGLFEPCAAEYLAVAALSRHGVGVDHVGVWLPDDGGVILHNDRHTGVIAQPPAQMQREGWQVLGYYRLRDMS